MLTQEFPEDAFACHSYCEQMLCYTGIGSYSIQMDQNLPSQNISLGQSWLRDDVHDRLTEKRQKSWILQNTEENLIETDP